ncbi:MAG: 4-hydroxy-tetrahydrodipicolinate reductase [Candidatus Marinimicrobia bacterium]|nr:4-hydroxy-tetrahydrodipicolinate reductase [Candidatus Neomarinimicrobiota bacterium]
MKLSLIGFGKMGRTIKNLAEKYNHKVISIVDPYSKEATHREISNESIQDSDVCIEFSTPESVISNIEAIARLKKDLVVGTTGWHNELNRVKELVEQMGIKLIYASNFAIGVNLFFMIVRYCARLVNQLNSYDVSIFEVHHSQKKDIPSGTAITLGDIIRDEMKQKDEIVTNLTGKIDPNQIHITGIRCGNIFGEHSVILDSNVDTILLSHRAKNREIFAEGVFFALDRLNKVKGMISFQDLLRDTLLKV